MLALVDEAEAILTDEQADLNEFGRLLDPTWKLKRGTGAAVSTDCIAALYARTAGITCPYEMTIACAENAVATGAELLADESIKEAYLGKKKS